MVLYAIYGLDEHSGTYGKFLRFLASGSYISGVYLIARRLRSFMHLQTLGAWAVYMHLESACRASCECLGAPSHDRGWHDDGGGGPGG